MRIITGIGTPSSQSKMLFPTVASLVAPQTLANAGLEFSRPAPAHDAPIRRGRACCPREIERPRQPGMTSRITTNKTRARGAYFPFSASLTVSLRPPTAF